MIVLDTNVISAVMQRDPDPIILAWLDTLPPESVWTTSITVFEIRFGIELLARGRRRKQLELAFSDALRDDFAGRVLAFDEPAAHAAGKIAALVRQAGRPGEIRDLEISGIVLAHKASLATRNTRHFEPTGVDLIDPWRAKPRR